MADDKQGVIHAASDGGVIGTHPAAEPLQILVGPTTSNEFNTARLRLIPLACFSVEDASFKFDSSFVLPKFQKEINDFIALREKDPERIKGAPISIFGHADPTFHGNFELGAPTQQAGDDYNKVLSGRRAIAVYGLLTRDKDIWENLFSHRFGGDDWGEDSIRKMLDFTDPVAPTGQQGQAQGGSGQGSGSSSSTDPNPGASDSARDAQVRSIARNAGQRQQLFLKYMDKLCGDLKLVPEKDFLARNADKIHHKGDVQGCSRFNPRLLFSQEKEASFKEAEKEREKEKDKKKDQPTLDQRNDENAPNRRVMILIFRKGSQVLPSKWPCPTFNEGPAACKKRFFSDGDTRRSTHLSGADKKFEDTHDTFACRFYQRLSDKSPCEKIVELVTLRIRLIDNRFIDGQDQAFDGLSYRLEVDTLQFEGVTAKDGTLEHRVPSNATSGKLTLIKKSEDGNSTVLWALNLEITAALGDTSSIPGAQARLNNLGFFAGEQITGQADDPTERALQRFQTFYKVKDQNAKPETSGILTGPTSDRLKEVYGS